MKSLIMELVDKMIQEKHRPYDAEVVDILEELDEVRNYREMQPQVNENKRDIPIKKINVTFTTICEIYQ